jgi:sec-independent protein translocase protein TatA
MFPNLQPGEMLVVLIVAVLLFGKRLPEVGRSLGKGIIEFKKGLRGMEDEVRSGSGTQPPARYNEPARDPEFSSASVPKFEPPSSAPVPYSPYESQPYHD